jgi:hypothetical protein
VHTHNMKGQYGTGSHSACQSSTNRTTQQEVQEAQSPSSAVSMGRTLQGSYEWAALCTQHILMVMAASTSRDRRPTTETAGQKAGSQHTLLCTCAWASRAARAWRPVTHEADCCTTICGLDGAQCC